MYGKSFNFFFLLTRHEILVGGVVPRSPAARGCFFRPGRTKKAPAGQADRGKEE